MATPSHESACYKMIDFKAFCAHTKLRKEVAVHFILVYISILFEILSIIPSYAEKHGQPPYHSRKLPIVENGLNRSNSQSLILLNTK